MTHWSYIAVGGVACSLSVVACGSQNRTAEGETAHDAALGTSSDHAQSGETPSGSAPNDETDPTDAAPADSGRTDDAPAPAAEDAGEDAQSPSDSTAVDSGVPCNPVVFGSPALELAVRRTLGLAEGSLSAESVAAVGVLHTLAADDAVTTLSGVECLTNLQDLHIADGTISSLEPLSDLQGLVAVSLPGHEISDLSPLNDKPMLQSLHFQRNSITDLTGLNLPMSDPDCPNILELEDNPVAEEQLTALCDADWAVSWSGGSCHIERAAGCRIR